MVDAQHADLSRTLDGSGALIDRGDVPARLRLVETSDGKLLDSGILQLSKKEEDFRRTHPASLSGSFEGRDIERHPVIEDVLQIYNAIAA